MVTSFPKTKHRLSINLIALVKAIAIKQSEKDDGTKGH